MPIQCEGGARDNSAAIVRASVCAVVVEKKRVTLLLIRKCDGRGGGLLACLFLCVAMNRNGGLE